jgi:copper transport protein
MRFRAGADRDPGGGCVVRARAAHVAAACALALLLAPAAASAHAVLITATPSSGAVLRRPPRTLTLGYDEDVVARYARVTVIGARGKNIGGAPRVTGSNVTVALSAAPKGSYTVRWRMVASDDGHTTEGAFSYGVRAKPVPPGPVGSLTLPVAPELLAWLQFVGIVLTGGLLSFRVARESRITLWVAVAGATVALHAALFGFLAGAYPIVGGGGLSSFIDTEIEPIRVGTHLGQAWMVMTFAWLAVLGLLLSAWVYPRRREPLLTGAGILALAIAFGLSWASHPASRGTLALLADYIHVLAAALWVGGLVALVIAVRSVPRPGREEAVRRGILQFSRLAAPTVAVVVLAGAYLALRELPSASALFSGGYGIALLIKASVAVAAVALGGYHRRFVVPRLAAGAPIATIRRTLVLELGLLVTVLALAAVLTQRAPPT